MRFKPGDLVSDRYGNSGVVCRIFDDFKAVDASCVTMRGVDWLIAQEIPIPPECLDEPWYSVDVDGGGSIWSPQSMLTRYAKGGEE